jgi:preprotein translocase subunit SecF
MIRFSKYIYIYFLLSALVLVPGMFSLARYGLKPSIDFTGGTLLEINKQYISKAGVEAIAKKANLPVVNIQETKDNTILMRLKASETEMDYAQLINPSGSTAAILRNETVGPILGKELLQKALYAALFAITGILLYVAYAFKNFTYGVSAVIALIHDLLVVLGIFAILGKVFGVEVDTLFVTAFLTTMSFSVHDTIVVFDRIREMQKKGEKGNLEELADRALTQTISRSVANSLTIIIMLLALFLLGGATVHWFVLALLIGTISGTYSSPFIATPVLLLWKRWEKRKYRISNKE